ncbi:Galactose oxidase-related protein [Croceitalea dokdonensis DOKDO 023]|uniref:Galactose oxidase-related protein n=1 Tax=Croceitalea dokdonensis DOKDO 023 TaxID=1300341 RepID=A0A0P7AMY3_9FLAO|nr:galactose oxidase-like domain-containing protein [Croceitalea dokdonensis]KPM30435.1 Galactose oxidase-related protein [Croceitalea dokdonensis DOKDO 023]
MKIHPFIFTLTAVFFSHFSSNSQSANEIGSWSDPIPFNLVPVSVANLPDGNLIVWSSKFRDNFGGADGFTYYELFNPFMGAQGTPLGLQQTNTTHDMFCPGINNLPDGRLLVSGGSSNPKTTIYDYRNDTWLPEANMNIGRGYQANVTLANGAALTFGGSWSGGLGPNGEKVAEYWTPENGWTILPGIRSDILWNQNDARLENRGVYRLDNHAWLWTAPNGKVFHAGPSEEMHWLDTTGNGSWTSAGKRGDDDYSMKGTSVMFDTGKLLTVGGARSYASGDAAKASSYVIDITSETDLKVTKTANNLTFSRTMHNSTVLPDGTVLVTGGLDRARVFTDVGARLNAELFDPETNQWRTVAGMQVPRTYHSVAILMNDARVFVGGGGLCGSCDNHLNAEIYSPPYLFDANGSLAQRPELLAPEVAFYEERFTVNASNNVEAFSFVRMSSATHSTNNEQRRIPVPFTVVDGEYQLNIPKAEIMPPGYYMLFAMDANGVPSVAESVQVKEKVNCAFVHDYSINGNWESGADEITVNEGDVMWMSMFPLPSFYEVIAPDGTLVQGNSEIGYTLGEISLDEAGLYTYRTGDGCVQTLEINVEPSGECSNFHTYSVNGIWSFGAEGITVNAGDEIWMSMFPVPDAFSVTGPNGLVPGNSQNGYTLGFVTPKQSGLYTFSIGNTCTRTLQITVQGDACGSLPSYSINGEWFLGKEPVTVETGDVMWLAIWPPTNYSISGPNGTALAGNSVDGYFLGTVTPEKKGTYRYVDAEGCEQELDINVQGIGLQAKLMENGIPLPSDAITILPNPSNGIFEIYLEPLSNQKFSLNIFNAVGSKVYQEDIGKSHGTLHTVDAQHLSSGLYSVHIETMDGKVHTASLILE